MELKTLEKVIQEASPVNLGDISAEIIAEAVREWMRNNAIVATSFEEDQT